MPAPAADSPAEEAEEEFAPLVTLGLQTASAKLTSNSNCNSSPRRRKCMCALLLMLISTSLIAGWLTAGRMICVRCNRIGNYLDQWYRRELLCAADANCKDAGQTHTGLQQFLWRAQSPHRNMPAAAQKLDVEVHGWARGVMLRGFFRELSPRAFATTVYPQRASTLPPPSFWKTAEALEFLRNHGAQADAWRSHYIWGTRIFFELLPYLRPSLHALIEKHPYGPRHDHDADVAAREFFAQRTCVLHYRTGEGLWQPPKEQWQAVARSIIAAIRSFRPPVERIEFLNGGSQHCDTCTVSFLGELHDAVRAALPNVAVIRMVGGSIDDDWLRAARAPYLVTGPGSFAVMAAAASRGQVRTPACIRFPYDSTTCVHKPPGVHGWHSYDHPQCQCREGR